MYQICFYVPKSHLETVKQAMFAAGAGNVGNYSYCSWQTLGIGQFMPLVGSNAYIGGIGQVTRVVEYQVIMLCDENCLPNVIAALKTAHPYEEVAYQVVQLVDVT
jgi:hypothetical protein